MVSQAHPRKNYAIIFCILRKGTAMTGSFLFVKPSDPEGKLGNAYSGESPRYPYDRASWEWMLERALRRTLLPLALTKSHSRVILYGHEGKYSMHRWGSYEESPRAGRTPTEYQSVGGPGSSSRKTDADLSIYAMEPLPESWNSSTGAPIYSYGTKVTYGIVDIEKAIANLPFSIEWLHPDWSSSSIDAWDLTASTTETTKGSAPVSPDGLNWTWETTVNHVPYSIPNDVPFKCLSHMRTDDPTVTVTITNDDNKAIEVETAPTPISAPRTTDGSIRDYHGTQVRSATHGAAYEAGWSLSEFYIKHKYGLDYSPSTDSEAFGRGDKTSDRNTTFNDHTLGCLVDIQDKDSGNIIVSRGANDEWAGFVHEVDWGGKQTWWHAKGFPKGIDYVLSQKLKNQLNTLCPVCQPSIPPAIPAFWKGFPDAGRLPWHHSPVSNPGDLDMYPQSWMRNLALACTPFDMSARLDAMTTTVHRVPTLFAKIKTKTMRYTSSYRTIIETHSESQDSKSWSGSLDREEVTIEGTSSNPLPAGNNLMSVSGKGSCVVSLNTSFSNPYRYGSTSDKTEYMWEESFESNSDFIVCLRSIANTTMSTKTTTNTYSFYESTVNDPTISESEESSGNLPNSYNPDPDDLLFPDWVLPWIENAELFASIASMISRSSGADYSEYEYHYDTDEGEGTDSYSGIGSGTRTHKVHRKIVSLGLMDTTTGRFPAIDAASILSDVDPDATEPSGWYNRDNYNSTSTETTDSNHNKTERNVKVVKSNYFNHRSRSVSYYVVVRWKFDRTDPETLETESPLADLYRKLYDARKALSDKEIELTNANLWLDNAMERLRRADKELAMAKEQLEDPDGAEPGLLEDAQSELDNLNNILSDAQTKKYDAQSEYDSAKIDMEYSEKYLQSAQAAYDAAVDAGEGVEEAQAALESAYTAYYKAVDAYGNASSKLADAEAYYTNAKLACDDAQDYYDTLHDNIEEILQKSVDDSQKEVDNATSWVEKYTNEVKEADSAIPDLEAAVNAAEQAIRDAGGRVP